MNTHYLKTLLAGLVSIILLPACTTTKTHSASPMVFTPKTINAIGYGTVEKSDRFSRSQIKLMAMRASKMDAYRGLAEQLNGIQMRGQTSVEDMQVSHDSYQIYLNAFLRGARVKRTSAIGSDIYAGDDTFETVVELDLTPRFYECINGSSETINQCLMEDSKETAEPEPITENHASTVSNSGCQSLDCNNFPITKGFSRK